MEAILDLLVEAQKGSDEAINQAIIEASSQDETGFILLDIISTREYQSDNNLIVCAHGLLDSWIRVKWYDLLPEGKEEFFKNFHKLLFGNTQYTSLFADLLQNITKRETDHRAFYEEFVYEVFKKITGYLTTKDALAYLKVMHLIISKYKTETTGEALETALLYQKFVDSAIPLISENTLRLEQGTERIKYVLKSFLCLFSRDPSAEFLETPLDFVIQIVTQFAQGELELDPKFIGYCFKFISQIITFFNEKGEEFEQSEDIFEVLMAALQITIENLFEETYLLSNILKCIYSLRKLISEDTDISFIILACGPNETETTDAPIQPAEFLDNAYDNSSIGKCPHPMQSASLILQYITKRSEEFCNTLLSTGTEVCSLRAVSQCADNIVAHNLTDDLIQYIGAAVAEEAGDEVHLTAQLYLMKAGAKYVDESIRADFMEAAVQSLDMDHPLVAAAACDLCRELLILHTPPPEGLLEAVVQAVSELTTNHGVQLLATLSKECANVVAGDAEEMIGPIMEQLVAEAQQFEQGDEDFDEDLFRDHLKLATSLLGASPIAGEQTVEFLQAMLGCEDGEFFEEVGEMVAAVVRSGSSFGPQMVSMITEAVAESETVMRFVSDLSIAFLELLVRNSQAYNEQAPQIIGALMHAVSEGELGPSVRDVLAWTFAAAPGCDLSEVEAFAQSALDDEVASSNKEILDMAICIAAADYLQTDNIVSDNLIPAVLSRVESMKRKSDRSLLRKFLLKVAANGAYDADECVMAAVSLVGAPQKAMVEKEEEDEDDYDSEDFFMEDDSEKNYDFDAPFEKDAYQNFLDKAIAQCSEEVQSEVSQAFAK